MTQDVFERGFRSRRPLVLTTSDAAALVVSYVLSVVLRYDAGVDSGVLVRAALHSVRLSLRGHALLDSDEVVLNDMRDEPALRAIFEARCPELVFHAAALKHLPMLEQYPHVAPLPPGIIDLDVTHLGLRQVCEEWVRLPDPRDAVGHRSEADLVACA